MLSEASGIWIDNFTCQRCFSMWLETMRIQRVVLTNVKNFKNQTEVRLSNYNIFVGKNGSGKSNLAKAIFKAVYTPTNQNVILQPFYGDQSVESSIGISVLFESPDVDKFKKSQFYKSNFSGKSVSAFKRSGFTIDRKVGIDSYAFNLAEFGAIEGFGGREKSFVQFQANSSDISSTFSHLMGQVQQSIVIIPDNRDLPASFSFEHGFQSNPVGIDNFTTYLMDIKLNKRAQYEKMVALYKRLVPDMADFNINPVGNNISVTETQDEFQILAPEISKGTREILTLVAMLVLARDGSSVFIEEPEIHLHPLAIKELNRIIKELAVEKKLQVTIITHNPIFLCDLEPELNKEVRVYRFERSTAGEAKVKPVRTDKEFEETVFDLELGNGKD